MSALQPQTPRALIARHPTPVPLLFFGGGDETLADGSRYNPSVISFIRDEWLYQQVKARCVALRQWPQQHAGILARFTPGA